MIIGILGNLSSGKTLLAIKLIYDELKKNPNKKIFSNIKLNFKYEHIDFESLVSNIINNSSMFFNSIVLADELHLLAESRRSSSDLNLTITKFITQLGKLNCIMIYTSQIFSQVDVRLRELTDILVFCERVSENLEPLFLKSRIVKEKIYIRCELLIKRYGGIKYTSVKFVFNPQEYYGLYDTREVVMLDRDKFLKK